MSTETLLLGIAMAVAAGLVGCFAVMRRMALASDALSHVALPGIGVALALHLNPLFGAVAMLFFGALIVWALDNRVNAATETLIGVVFSAALAIGSLTTSGEQLLEALFGGAGTLKPAEVVFGFVAAAAIVAFMLAERNSLVVMLVSPDLARTTGINVRRLNLLYLEMFALTIALGLRYLGVLLMGALIIIPAATAKRLARRLDTMLLTAVAIAVAATLAGSWAAARLHRETGPLIVLAAAAMFVIALLRPAAE
ncbi:MAG: metal ABC transporter permease [Acidobacteria bacterium]|nr:metal ABC transporter permease [Acidobacteriota bacterium]